MDARSFARTALKNAHHALKETVADVTTEDAHWIPQGTAHPIGSRYAHIVIAEDVQIHMMLQGKPPLFEVSFKGKTGVSDTTFRQSLEWARTVKIDLSVLAIYRDAVFAESEKYFDVLTDADLARSLDLTAMGIGQVPLPIFLSDFVIGHCHDVMGEISAVKGLLGKKGYPF